MALWYFIENGKAQGPFNEEDLVQAATKGRLGPLDLIFQEGSERWVPARDEKILQSIFRQIQENPESQPQWIVLQKKKRDEGAGYVQSGPFSNEEIREKIKRGEVDYADYIWRDGQEEWKKVTEIREFNPQWKGDHSSNPLPDLPGEEKDQYPFGDIKDEVPGEELLKSVVHLERSFDEDEEVTEKEIDLDATQDFVPLDLQEELLKKKSLPQQLSDPKSEESSATDSFSESVTQTMIDPNGGEFPLPPSLEQQEFLRERNRRHPKKPQGIDETQLATDSVPVVAKREELVDEVVTQLRRLTPSLSWGLFMTVIALIFLSTGAWLIYSSLPKKEEIEAARRQRDLDRQEVERRQRNLQKPVPQERTGAVPSSNDQKMLEGAQKVHKNAVTSPEVLAGSSPNKKSQETVSRQKPSPPSWPRKTPTSLQIQALDGQDLTKAHLKFVTDGSHHFPVDLIISAKAGDILGRPSYWRHWSLKGKPGDERIFKLGPLNLGEGQYQIVAKIDTVGATTKVFLGKQSSRLRDSLNVYRKKISWSYQQERKRLYQLTEKILDLAKELGSQGPPLLSRPKDWNRFYQSWSRKLRGATSAELKIQNSSAQRFLFPEEWMELRDRRQGLLHIGSVVNGTKKFPNPPGSDSIQGLTNDLNQLLQVIKKTSLWY